MEAVLDSEEEPDQMIVEADVVAHENFFKEVAPPSGLQQSHASESDSYAVGPLDTPNTEEKIGFLIKSVQYSRLMSAIHNKEKLRDVVKTMQRLKVHKGDVVIQQGDAERV